MQSQFLAKMSQSLKHTLNYFSGNPNLSSQLKLQKFDKAGSIIGQRKANLSLKSVLLFMANSGVVRWSLITMLPFIVLAIFSSQVKFTHSTETISVPKNFCELDKRESCTAGKCIRYDPLKFKTSPSIMTYIPGGRLGNKMSAFLMLLWLKLDFGFDVYFPKDDYEFLMKIFENVNGTMNVLEDDLCECSAPVRPGLGQELTCSFPFQKYEGAVDLLGTDEWKTGQAIRIFLARENFMRHEIQGGRKYYKKFKKEVHHTLNFKPHIQSFAQANLLNIAKKLKTKPQKITYVGIHNRRTDYLEFRRKRLKLDNLYEDYFEDAMEYFMEEYGPNVAFVYVSDDMKWGRRKLSKVPHSKNLFFIGCGDFDEVECIGKDMALLANCNHTITTHGSFGHWAAYLAGGEVYTEYGTIIPDAMNT